MSSYSCDYVKHAGRDCTSDRATGDSDCVWLDATSPEEQGRFPSERTASQGASNED